MELNKCRCGRFPVWSLVVSKGYIFECVGCGSGKDKGYEDTLEMAGKSWNKANRLPDTEEEYYKGAEEEAYKAVEEEAKPLCQHCLRENEDGDDHLCTLCRGRKEYEERAEKKEKVRAMNEEIQRKESEALRALIEIIYPLPHMPWIFADYFMKNKIQGEELPEELTGLSESQRQDFMNMISVAPPNPCWKCKEEPHDGHDGLCNECRLKELVGTPEQAPKNDQDVYEKVDLSLIPWGILSDGYEDGTVNSVMFDIHQYLNGGLAVVPVPDVRGMLNAMITDFGVLPLAQALGYGARKYYRDSWQKGFGGDVKRIFEALLRHGDKYQRGEEFDGEAIGEYTKGTSHIGAVMWCLMVAEQESKVDKT